MSWKNFSETLFDLIVYKLKTLFCNIDFSHITNVTN